MIDEFMFTSESATPGHPDKLCDQISDAIVDRFLAQEPSSRIIAESAVSGGVVFIGARFASEATVDVAEVAREVAERVGYTEGEFNASDCTVMTSLLNLPEHQLRPLDVSRLGPEELDSVTAANQATAFGFACDHSPSLMPLPIVLAHALAERLYRVRAEGLLPYLMPDGKTQVGVEFRGLRPVRIHSISLLAAQREAGSPTPRALHDDLREAVIEPVFRDRELRPDAKTGVFVNPEGPFVTGGPTLHSGLTGRKTGVDTYGEFSRQSGAALSGKSPLCIDRVGAYAARHAAKNLVAAGLASQCELQVSYSIGQAQPVSVHLDAQGTASVSEEEILQRVRSAFDFRPAAIVRRFDLQRIVGERGAEGFYRRLAVFGHMGREDLDAPWERLDAVDALK